MISFGLWYISVTLLGWLAFPIAYRIFPALPDRGYNLARALGLLLWGYIFWLLASLGFLQNDTGGLMAALILVAVITAWAGWRSRFKATWVWVKTHRKLVITSEMVFLGAFALWTLVRAMNPEINGTEKPMEMAFINAILHSATFPPHDPWLSGYAISYYYFGYIMVAMLIEVTGISSGVGFNLAIALWFGLTASGCYGILYNLLVGLRCKNAVQDQSGPGKDVKTRSEDSSGNLFSSLFGPIFILLVSNLDGILEVLHARGLFWQKNASGQWVSNFWTWLDIQELNQPPSIPFSWIPTRPGGILWWRASRVIQDYTVDHQAREIIDEFPFFSYLLSDLHPHVLAMPFALLAIGLALNLYLHGAEGETRFGNWFKIPIRPAAFLSGAVILGGLAFLNTWDFPIYVALFCAAYALLHYQMEGWSVRWVGEMFILGLAEGLAGAILYLPFYLGFSSQAGGIIPSMIFSTPGIHFWVMFAFLLIPIALFILFVWKHTGRLSDLRSGLSITTALILALLIFSYGLGIAASFIPALGESFLAVQGATQVGIWGLIRDSLLQRLVSPGTWLTLGLLLVFIVALIKGQYHRNSEDHPTSFVDDNPSGSMGFIFLLIFFGGLLTLAPEFIYLRDQFGYRINTIFKFYFQTWMVWGLAAAFSVAFLLSRLKGLRARLFQVGLVVLLLVSFLYPAFGLWDKTNHFASAKGLTLDGTSTLSPDELAAVQWLRREPVGVVTEAINQASSYSNYSRISEYSGDPTIIGWTGHESQWRGNSLNPAELGIRVTNVETLYRTADWQQTLQIINQYGVRYIFVGDLERSSYRVSESKFQRYLKIVFSQGSVVIYEAPVSETSASETSASKTTEIGHP